MSDNPEDRIFLLRSDAIMAGRKTNVGGLETPTVGDDAVTYVREDLFDTLASTAQELLEALENLTGVVDTPIGRRKLGLHPDDARLVEARAAIAKAKGE